ncbi:hypothetical protein ACTHGU_03230 [Chitinophagaceae bacterium MMS25-I14]
MDKAKWLNLLKCVGIPVAYAIVLRLFFGVHSWEDLFSVMTVSFLFCLPTIVGALAVYYSNIEKVKKLRYRIIFPWLPVIIFFFITLLFSLEGWACWLMILPVFLVAASIGGLIGGYFKLRKYRRGNLYISLLTLLPLFLSPVESMIGSIPGTYEAYTDIDIHADAPAIWSHVTRVGEIMPEEDKGWLTGFLGFPRPLRAELNYEGVGASREAIFSKGLVFHEKVLQYEHQKQMRFSIKAFPYEIPSTTMDSHVVIGGKYFDVLDGTYQLEKLSDQNYRLHLYSHFKLKTTFNFYAGWWVTWIMKDIQNNILQVIKARCEEPGA